MGASNLIKYVMKWKKSLLKNVYIQNKFYVTIKQNICVNNQYQIHVIDVRL